MWNIEDIKKIARNEKPAKVNGYLIDVKMAYAILQTYFGRKDKEKYQKWSIKRFSDLAVRNVR